MVNQWTLHVRNFGKITEAAITISPFMIFVGKNNSGKSYMMELLWGIVNEARSMIDRHMQHSLEFDALFVDYISKLPQLPEGAELEIEQKDQQSLLAIFNDILDSEKERLVQKIFNQKISVGSLEIRRESYPRITISKEKSQERFIVDVNDTENNLENTQAIVTINIEGQAAVKLLSTGKRNDATMYAVLSYTLLFLICKDYYDPTKWRSEMIFQPLYLPASRTGFMHTYRAIMGNIFESTLSEHLIPELPDESQKALRSTVSGAELTLPVIQFLSKLQKHNFDEKQQEKYSDEIKFINEQILHGQVTKDEFGQFRYTPENSQTKLPLHVTSSLVAELAPISIFLSSIYDPDLWIIEELESHLHSEMQLEVTRLLFRLLNKGKSLWLTTHSDNLAQQINNLLTLSRHPHQDVILKQLNYSKQDLIPDTSIARVYQFETVDGVTIVKELELGDYGFVMNTFNDTLGRLIKETDIIQNFAEESRD